MISNFKYNIIDDQIGNATTGLEDVDHGRIEHDEEYVKAKGFNITP